jgi:hypothetical protein
MTFWELKDFRADLSKFLDLIKNYDIGDFQELNTLLGNLNSPMSDDLIKYELKNIVFHIKKCISGSRPFGLNKFQIFFDNTITVEKNFNLLKDNLKEYKFELNIDSYISTSESDGNCYKSCWHLDKHIDSSPPKYTHPTYHFHFGGEYINSLDTGQISILANPRIPHPPMDLFLGFHFIISNFYSSKDYTFVNELKSQIEYQKIIKRAQERLWIPYFKAFNPTNTNQDFTMNKLFPLFID